MTELILVGCGNMGFAMMSGWLAASDAPIVHVVEPNDTLRERARMAGAHAVRSADDLPKDAAPDLIFLAVKPQVMGDVAPQYTGFGKATFVSVAAGTGIDALKRFTGAQKIIRCMPNTPAAIGMGMMVCCATDAVRRETRDQASALLANSGEVAWIDDESLMDAVTAISGSGPAYVFHMIEALAAAGKALDLPEDVANQLALQTVKGAGALAAGSDTSPGDLRVQVTSPGGTTAAALNVLMDADGLERLLKRATKAARDKGRDLGRD